MHGYVHLVLPTYNETQTGVTDMTPMHPKLSCVFHQEIVTWYNSSSDISYS